MTKSLTLKVFAIHDPNQPEANRLPMSERGNGGYDARRSVGEVIAETEAQGWVFRQALQLGPSKECYDLIFTPKIEA